MKTPYKMMFKRGKIGNVELKNRIFKPAAEDSCCGDGFVPDYLCKFYAEEARGGAGLIICGMYVVTPRETAGLDRHPLITTDNHIPGFGKLAQAIQDNGAKACCQLGHFGSHGEPVNKDWYRCVSYAPLEEPGAEEWFTVFNATYWHMQPPYPHKEYTTDEIHELVGFYGDAALRAKKAGWDMVELHAGHRHGLGCFLSPLTNRRTDEYGGSVENRARILYEAVADVQKKCGKDFPIIVRMNGQDGPGLLQYAPAVEKGQQIDQTIEIAKHLEAMGVAALNISIQDTNVPMQAMKYGVAVDGAEAVRKAVNIPVLVAGSIQTPEFGEEVLESGKADFVGTARQLYADPNWPKKAMRGQREDIRPCIRCMECVNNDRHQWYGPLCCTVNPTVGKPEQYIKPAETKKKVAVVGGGPAGMEAARTAALRGHDVTLFEKRRLGGLLHEASTPDFKADIRRLIDYYDGQMQKLNIAVVNEEAGFDQLKDFDAVVLATGSTPIALKVPGADGKHVYKVLDVLDHLPEDMGEQVTVIGGGSVGAEVAIWLAQHGKKATIVEMRERILMDEMVVTLGVDSGLIQQLGIKVITNNSLERITDGAVVIADQDGKETTLATDAVVMAVGLKPNRSLLEQLDNEFDGEVYPVGDCSKPRKIYDAIHEGYIAAMEI
ncbi:MAG: FAD-dependent oxidoreductase [Pseudoramibacter sp.]